MLPSLYPAFSTGALRTAKAICTRRQRVRDWRSPASDRCRQPQSHRSAACKPMPAGPQRQRVRDPQRQLDHTPTSRGKSPASGDVRCRSPHADPIGKCFRTTSDNRRAIASTSLAPAPDRHRFGKGTDQIRSDLASVGLRESWHRESGGGERRRGRRPAGFCQEQTLVMTEQIT